MTAPISPLSRVQPPPLVRFADARYRSKTVDAVHAAGPADGFTWFGQLKITRWSRLSVPDTAYEVDDYLRACRAHLAAAAARGHEDPGNPPPLYLAATAVDYDRFLLVGGAPSLRIVQRHADARARAIKQTFKEVIRGTMESVSTFPLRVHVGIWQDWYRNNALSVPALQADASWFEAQTQLATLADKWRRRVDGSTRDAGTVLWLSGIGRMLGPHATGIPNGRTERIP